MNPTIYDVAKIAGVSPATVSRVLNGNYPVSEKTRRRVELAIEQSGFSRNHVARSLVTKSTGVLGVIGTDVTNPYFVEVMGGIHHIAAEHGMQLMLQNSRDVNEEIDALRLLLDRRVDGIVMVARQDQAENVDHILDAASKRPLVLIGYPSLGASVMSVRAKEEDGMAQLASELRALGHHDILFLGGNQNSFPTQVKLKGLKRVLTDVDATNVRFLHCGYSYDAAREAVETYIKRGLIRDVTAIVAVSDVVAVAALDALFDRGIEVPNEISVTGFDNIFWSSSVRPKLTTVNPQKDLLAAEAVDMIKQAIASGPLSRLSRHVPAHVVLRQSLSFPRGMQQEAMT